MTIHYGNPVWSGPPSKERIAAIRGRCVTTEDGRRYFYDEYGNLRRLHGKEPFERLNRILGPS